MLETLKGNQYLSDDRLLLALYKLGMANRRHLSVVLGWTDATVKWRINKIRSERGKTAEEKNQWIQYYVPPHRSKMNLYYLGEKGLAYCVKALNQAKKKPVAHGQWEHYEGLYNIYLRVMESANQVVWRTTQEATEYLFRSYKLQKAEEWKKEPKLERETKKNLIHPDALVVINGKMFWMEFDNSTESSSQLEERMEGYIRVMNDLKETAPVVWVVKDAWRKADLQFVWGYTSKGHAVVPRMEFFVQGEEVDFLCSSPATSSN
ncbi:protein involved in plasmid replication-relaxation [Laceyella sacchari]|jgi:Replication-relaxation|uniref:replication-relaxation family protein n=1 Tax=Laceyella sacchari TaxID=37482 RepID=UPI001049C5CA|nr:replication-relaxation family protein [Laceyella sacchari]TCW41590.1 protein involved in plasmid replication-relaxation [Laceyella sacchari]